jgi:hypothetical protein
MHVRTLIAAVVAIAGLAGLTISAASAAPKAPCKVLPAAKWSQVMGYSVTTQSTDMYCTYLGAGNSGGQFRYVGISETAAAAQAMVKRLKSQSASHTQRGLVDSKGNVVFSIAAFPMKPGDKAKLEALRAEVRRNL